MHCYWVYWCNIRVVLNISNNAMILNLYHVDKTFVKISVKPLIPCYAEDFMDWSGFHPAQIRLQIPACSMYLRLHMCTLYILTIISLFTRFIIMQFSSYTFLQILSSFRKFNILLHVWYIIYDIIYNKRLYNIQ